MILSAIVAALLSGSTATPAMLGNCVSDEAVKLARLPKPSKELAPLAVQKCRGVFEQVAAERDASVVKYHERPSAKRANSRAWRQSLNKIMTQLAVTTIEQRRATRIDGNQRRG